MTKSPIRAMLTAINLVSLTHSGEAQEISNRDRELFSVNCLFSSSSQSGCQCRQDVRSASTVSSVRPHNLIVGAVKTLVCYICDGADVDQREFGGWQADVGMGRDWCRCGWRDGDVKEKIKYDQCQQDKRNTHNVPLVDLPQHGCFPIRQYQTSVRNEGILVESRVKATRYNQQTGGSKSYDDEDDK
jgi:hypothetical protein